jgi:hypothetical protein
MKGAGVVCRLFAVVVVIKSNLETLLSDPFRCFALLHGILRQLASWSGAREQQDKLFGRDNGMLVNESEV